MVAFVLVNYKGNDDTIECIKSINDQISYDNFSIIVVDNSEDERYYNGLITYSLENTHVYRSEKNKGFAAGCNLGTRHALEAGAEYVILLNNDTVIVSADLIERMLDCFEKSDVGMVSGRIMYYDNPQIPWFEAGYISKVRLRAESKSTDKPVYTPFATGCLQMISAKAIEKVGFMDEDYFMFYEDVAYCRRFADSGFRIAYDPKVVIQHKVSRSAPSSTAMSVYYSNRSRYLYIKRFENGNIPAKISYWVELLIKLVFYDSEKRRRLLGIVKEIVGGFWEL